MRTIPPVRAVACRKRAPMGRRLPLTATGAVGQVALEPHLTAELTACKCHTQPPRYCGHFPPWWHFCSHKYRTCVADVCFATRAVVPLVGRPSGPPRVVVRRAGARQSKGIAPGLPLQLSSPGNIALDGGSWVAARQLTNTSGLPDTLVSFRGPNLAEKSPLAGHADDPEDRVNNWFLNLVTLPTLDACPWILAAL